MDIYTAQWSALASANLAATFECVARGLDRPCAWWDEALSVDGSSAELLMNAVVLRRPATATSDLADVVSRAQTFHDNGVGAGWSLWSVWPTPDLTPLGLTHFANFPVMVRPPDAGPPPPATDLRIVEALDTTTLADFESVIINGFPLAPTLSGTVGTVVSARMLGGQFHAFVGYAGEQPASCSATYLDAAVNGVNFVATLPEFRGHGYGAAISYHAATIAPHLPAILGSSPAGYPVYRRLGFTDVGQGALWGMPRQG